MIHSIMHPHAAQLYQYFRNLHVPGAGPLASGMPLPGMASSNGVDIINLASPEMQGDALF